MKYNIRRGRTPVDAPTNAPPEPGPSHTEALAGHRRHTDARAIYLKAASLPRHPTLTQRFLFLNMFAHPLSHVPVHGNDIVCIAPPSEHGRASGGQNFHVTKRESTAL